MAAQVRVTIKYLSAVRDRAGLDREEVAFEAGETVGTLIAWLADRRGLDLGSGRTTATLNGTGLNQQPDGPATRLRDGDTVFLFQQVSGG